MQLQGYGLVGVTETWWGGSRGWGLAMEGRRLSRCGGSGGKRAAAQQHGEEESLGFVLRRFPRPSLGEQGLCSADPPLAQADLSRRDAVPTLQERRFRGQCHRDDGLGPAPLYVKN